VLGGLTVTAQTTQLLQELHRGQSFVVAHEALWFMFGVGLAVSWSHGVAERSADSVVAPWARLHLVFVIINAAGARITSDRQQVLNSPVVTRVQGCCVGGITRRKLQCGVVGRGLR